MILLLNSNNLLGQAIAAELLKRNKRVFYLKSYDCVNNLTVSYDALGAFWFIAGHKAYIQDFTAVYCGGYGDNALVGLNGDSYESYYLASCWEAYLQYVLSKIPVKLGVVSNRLSLGNFLQLPAFYKIIRGFGLDAPQLLYICDATSVADYLPGANYHCSNLYCDDISDFKEATGSPVLLVEKKFNMWGKILIVAQRLYFFTLEHGVWLERELAHNVKKNIIKLLSDFELTLGKIILRYDSDYNKHVFYSITLKLSVDDMRLLPANIADVAICFLGAY